MDQNLIETRDAIVEASLPRIPFDGWVLQTVEDAAASIDMDPKVVMAVFPAGLKDVINHFSDLTDRQMLEQLKSENIEDLRIRDRINKAVLIRLKVLEPHKDAVRQALTYWTVPTRTYKAGQAVWRTSDRIWIWAGDTSEDYNKYTKRFLLSGVLSSTTLAWLNDDDPEMVDTENFLQRRIENVLSLGKIIGRFKNTA